MKITHKIVTKRAAWASKEPQGEIKVDCGGTQCLIIVAVDGWNYRDQYGDCKKPSKRLWGNPETNTSAGKQVRISMNGPLMLTEHEWLKINEYINNVFNEVKSEWARRV